MITVATFDRNCVLHSADDYSKAVVRFDGIGSTRMVYGQDSFSQAPQRSVRFISEVNMTDLEMKELNDFLLRIRNAR